jgi:hypothetical protein
VIVVSKRREIMLRELCAMHFNLMTEVHWTNYYYEPNQTNCPTES